MRHSASSEAYDALTAFLAEMETLDQMEMTSCSRSSGSGSDTSGQRTCSPASSTTSSPPPTPPLPTVPPTPKTKAAPGKKRIRAKQEIDMLRNDVEALQQQLAALQATETQAQSAGEVLQEQQARRTSAKKPRLRRVSCPVLAENQHLRKLIDIQQKLSKQIASVLGKMQKTEVRVL